MRLRGRRAGVLVLAMLAGAVGLLVGSGDEATDLSCRVLPNGRVSVIPDLRAPCPLDPLDQVHSVGPAAVATPWGREALAGAAAPGEGSLRVTVRRDGRRVAFDVPLLARGTGARAASLAAALALAAALVALPVGVLRRSPAPAALPFAALCGAIAALVFAAASGVRSPWIYRLEAAALVALPSALAHLALVFPAPRPVLAAAPALARLPWAAGGLALPVAWLALERDALLWPALCYLLIVLGALAWAALLAAACSDARASGAALERVRARLLVCATLFLPLPPAWLLAELAPHGRHGSAQVLLAALALVPLPLGVVVSRYDLFELGADARRAAARLLFYTAAAGLGTAGAAASPLFAPDAAAFGSLELFASGLVCVALADGARGALLGHLEAALDPADARLRVARASFARRAPALREEAQVLRELGAELVDTLAPRHLAAFALHDGVPRPLFAWGRGACLAPAVARQAASWLGPRAWLQVSRAPDPRDARARVLAGRDVELVGALGARGALLGVVLSGPSAAGPMGRAEGELLETACTHAAAALANARRAEELVGAERDAAIGRAALGLAHDLGKELDWIRHLAKRLPARLADPARARRDLRALDALAEDLAGAVRGFVRDAVSRSASPRDEVPLADLLDRVAREAARRRGERPVVSVDAVAARTRVDPGLRHVLSTLVDNALLAEPRAGPVHVVARCELGKLRIAVRDHGPGLGPELLCRAFEPGFTTRLHRGGCGVGLAIAREVVHELGGSIQLEPAEGRGLRASVELPHAEVPWVASESRT